MTAMFFKLIKKIGESSLQYIRGKEVLSNLGSSCSTAVKHTPVEQNSWGRGFESRWVLGFLLLFSILSVVYP